jgi:hypothetical protein
MKNERISPSRFEARYEIIRGVYWVVLLSPALNLRHQAMSTAEYGSTVYSTLVRLNPTPWRKMSNPAAPPAARNARTCIVRAGRPPAEALLRMMLQIVSASVQHNARCA